MKNLETDQKYLEWLHGLTLEGYKRNDFISTDHRDAIMTIYILKGDDSIKSCFDLYQDFRRRWIALGGAIR